MDNKQIQNNNGGNGPKMNMPKFNMNWIYVVAIVALGLLYFSSGGPTNSSVAKAAMTIRLSLKDRVRAILFAFRNISGAKIRKKSE